jgi:hypothetical protein
MNSGVVRHRQDCVLRHALLVQCAISAVFVALLDCSSARPASNADRPIPSAVSDTEQVHQPAAEFAWAGAYDVGGRSLYPSPDLTITLRDGMTYRFASCTWQGTPQHFPIVRASENRIEVDLGGDASDLPGLSRAYVYTSWGSTEFLVPEDRMPQFCFYANDLSNLNARVSPFPMRPTWWATSAGTPIPAPIVPPQFQKYLLRDVVEAVVLESSSRLTGEEYLDQPIAEAAVLVDAGSDRGLLPGMSLFVGDWGEGKLVEVGASTSRAVFRRCVPDERSLSIAIGAKVASTAPARK